MDIEDLEKFVNKVFGPLILLLVPIGFFIFMYDTFFKIGNDKLSTKDSIFFILFCMLSLYIGFYMCRKEYGWFKKKEK